MAKIDTKTTSVTNVGLKDNQPSELGEIVTDWYPDFLNKENTTIPDEKKATDHVELRLKSMKKARSAYETIWTTNEQSYRVEPGTVDEKDDAESWRSTNTTPLTHGLVETAVSEFIDSEPDYEIASQKESEKDNVGIIKKIVEHTRYKGDYDYQKQISFRSIGIYGSTIWWEYYREDPRFIKTLKSFDDKTKKKTYEIAKTTEFNDCYGEWLSPWNFYPDENAKIMSEANDCIRREVLNWSDFVRVYQDYPGFPLAKAGGNLDNNEAYPIEQGSNDEDRIEILHYYNKPYDIYWIDANGTLMNEFESSLPDDHKELPFADGAYIKMPGHFWGIGMPQILAGTQAELDTIRRLRLDRSKLNISKVFLTSNREDLSDAEIAMSPGKRISVNDPAKSIMALEFSDTGASGYREEEALMNDARYATGVSDPSAANVTGATATESAIVKEATLKRLRACLATNKTLFFERIGELRLANILQHYQDPIKVNKITGANGEEKWEAVYREVQTPDAEGKFSSITVKPEDLRGNFTFYVKPTTNIPLSFELEKEQKRQMFDRIVAIPVVDPEKAIRWLFDAHKDDADKVLMKGIGVPDEELADSENARMMQGANIPPTLNAVPAHTQRHYKFIVENAWQIDQSVDQVISAHVNGELNPVSPAGVGGVTPPVGLDGNAVGTAPMAGSNQNSNQAADLAGMMNAPQGAAPNGLNPVQGGEMPAAADSGSAISPDMSIDQQLQR